MQLSTLVHNSIPNPIEKEKESRRVSLSSTSSAFTSEDEDKILCDFEEKPDFFFNEKLQQVDVSFLLETICLPQHFSAAEWKTHLLYDFLEDLSLFYECLSCSNLLRTVDRDIEEVAKNPENEIFASLCRELKNLYDTLQQKENILLLRELDLLSLMIVSATRFKLFLHRFNIV